MKKISLLLWGCLACALSQAQSSFIPYNTLFSNSSIRFDSAIGIAVSQLQTANPNDTFEGGVSNAFKRWNNFWDDRVSNNPPSGLTKQQPSNIAYGYYLKTGYSTACNQNSFQGQWKCIGPFNSSFNSGMEMQGRIDQVWINPSDTNEILVGSNGGGVWKTTNAGQSWHNITDGVGVNSFLIPGTLGVNSMAVDPLDYDNICIATGVYSLKDINTWTYGIGMLITTDGGTTWQEDAGLTGAGFFKIGNAIKKVAFKPGTHQMIAIYENNRILYRSSIVDNWQDVSTSFGSGVGVTDFEFSLVDPDVVAFSTTDGKIWRYDISANSWVSIPAVSPSGTTLAAEGIKDMTLTSADNAIALVYLANGSVSIWSTSIFSNTWNQVNASISRASATSIQVSPSNASIIYVGHETGRGGDIQRSTDGGVTFNSISGSAHGDTRCITLLSSTNTSNGINDVVYFGTDGGIVKKRWGQVSCISITGDSLCVTQFHGMSGAELDDRIVVGGAQDNGIFNFVKQRTTQWDNALWGDGYRVKFGNINPQGLGSVNYPRLNAFDFTSNILVPSLVDIPNPFGGVDPECNAIWADCANSHRQISFTNSNTAYTAYRSIFRNDITGTSGWADAFNSEPLDNQPTLDAVGRRIAAFKISQADSNVVYIAYRREAYGNPTESAQVNNPRAKLFVSQNAFTSGTPTWVNITPPVVEQYRIMDIEIDPNNPERIWVALGNIDDNHTESPSIVGTDTVKRVFYSSDFGQSWKNVSNGLSALPVNKIVYQEGSDDILYAGTDVGVFKWNKVTNKWECFSEDMPPCIIMELEINYCSGKLRAATYGRGMWETSLFSPTDVVGTSNEINVNTTWNTSRSIKGNVRIKSGKTLTIQKNGTIKPTIYMAKNSKIIVEQGAQLIIDGAILTNSCEDCQWSGIEIWGNVGQVQTTSNQGFAWIKDATIQHAINAIKNWDGTNFATTGGIIKVDNSKFLNNSTSVSIQHYSYNSAWSAIYKNYAANFTNDTFDINNEFKGGSTSPFNEHVSLNHVDGVRFNGCQFLNRNQTPSLKGTGVGIKARDAGFYVRKLCNLSICTDKCRFKGLTFGIYTEATNNTLYGASIDQAVFDSCTFGIKINKQDFVQVTRDSFIIGRGKSGDVSGTECFKNVGLFVTGTCSPIVEDNIFAGVTTPGIENLGVIMQSTGEADKQVYHNSFTSLGRGILAINNNKDRNITTSPFPPTSPAWFTGLRILCNSFQSNSKDIHVDANGSIVNAAWKINEGIAAYQGDPSKPAGNTFPTSGITHIDNTGNFINYFYASSQPNSNPANITYCAKYSINVNPSCTSRNGTFDLPLGNSQTNGIKNVGVAKRVGLLSALSQYESLLDNGDTEAMKSYINGKTLADSATVRTTLLGLSPYLSDELLKHVANANVLHPGVFAKILIANPDVMRDGHLLEFFLDNHPGLIATEQIADIEDSYDNTTARTTKEGQISTLTAEMQLAATQVITNMLLDTVAAPVDSMVAWLNFVGTVNSEYAKASYYAGLGDYTEADNILSDLPTKYTLTLDEETEYNQYLQMWTTIKDIYTDGRTFEQMSTPELTTFTILHDASIPNDRINVITGTITGIPLSPQWKIPCNLTKYVGHMKQGTTQTSPNRTKANKGIQRNIEKRNVFNVYPNPATDLVTFDFRVPLTKEPVVITITNVAGQTIETFTSETNFGNIRWNTQNISSGVYMYKITTDKLLLETGRVVISK